MRKLRKYTILLVISIFFLAIGLATFYLIEKKVTDNNYKEINFASEISLSAVDPNQVDLVAQIIPADISQTDGYVRLKEQIVKLGNTFKSRGIDAVYLLSKKDNIIYFIVESTPEGEPLYVPSGKLYEKPPVEIFNTFNDKKSFITDTYTDEYGTYLSEFSPVFNNSGELVGVLGVDVDYTIYQSQIFKIKIIFWSAWFLLCLFVDLIFSYFSKSYKLKQESIVSEEKILAISNSIDDGVVVINSDSQIIFWNKTSEKIFGYSFDQVLGLKFEDLVKIDSLVDIETSKKIDNLELSLNNPITDKILEVKLNKDKKNKKYYELRSSIAEINEEHNLVCVFHDISKRKEEEFRLQRQKDEMESLNNLMVGRELKMIELKKNIADLKNKKKTS